MKIEQFEDLEIWQEARELCIIIHGFCSREPFSNDYKLRGQICGSSGSIMDNIAEACLPVGRVLREMAIRSSSNF